MRLGIDIGTDAARAAYVNRRGEPELVRFEDGRDWMPALVRQTMHGLQVGEAAARALVGNRETTVTGCVRLMGRAGGIDRALLERLPFAVAERNGEIACNLLYAEHPASALYGALLRALADAAERQSGEIVDEVVLTVPASAEDRFRVQAREAAAAHGLRVRRLLNQPAAALLAAGLPAGAGKVAVVSCGGGALDVSLAERSAQGARIVATAGDSGLGGDDLVWALTERLNQRFVSQAGVDVFRAGQSQAAALGLRAAVAEALETLNAAPTAMLAIDHGGGFGRDLLTALRRADVAEWLAPLLEGTAALCQRALAAAGWRAAEVAAVVLTGEWSHLAALREAIAAGFGRPAADLTSAGARTLTVLGAALATRDDAPTIWDVTPYPLGINCYFGEEELLSTIVAANTPIPTPKPGEPGAFVSSYTTRLPDQKSVTLAILQYRGPKIPAASGSHKVRPAECEELGSWEFAGLKPRKGRHAPFTVTFAIDADGILHLHAHETATGHHLDAHVDRGIG